MLSNHRPSGAITGTLRPCCRGQVGCCKRALINSILCLKRRRDPRPWPVVDRDGVCFHVGIVRSRPEKASGAHMIIPVFHRKLSNNVNSLYAPRTCTGLRLYHHRHHGLRASASIARSSSTSASEVQAAGLRHLAGLGEAALVEAEVLERWRKLVRSSDACFAAAVPSSRSPPRPCSCAASYSSSIRSCGVHSSASSSLRAAMFSPRSCA